MTKFMAVLFALTLVLVAVPATAGTLYNDTPGENMWFGWGSSTCGLRTAVGEPGRWEVNVFNTAGTTIAIIQSSVPEFDAGYGRIVKLSEDCQWLLVTAPFSDKCGGVNSGAGFVYHWNGCTYGSEMLLCGTDTGAGHELGRSGDINEDGTLVVLGAYKHDSAYAFVRGAPWVAKKLAIPDVTPGADLAGFCVGVSEDTVLVTSLTKYNVVGGLGSIGEANLFRKDQGGTNNFGHIAMQVVSGSKELGYGCDISLPDFALGDPLAGPAVTHPGSGQGRGVVYQFHLANNTARLEETVLPVDTITQDDQEFGSSISLSGGNMYVGSPYYDGNGLVDSGFSTALFRKLNGWKFDFGDTANGADADDDRWGWSVGTANGWSVASSPFVSRAFASEGQARVWQQWGVFTDGLEMGDALHWSKTSP